MPSWPAKSLDAWRGKKVRQDAKDMAEILNDAELMEEKAENTTKCDALDAEFDELWDKEGNR